MIILGVILLLIGYLVPVPILATIGLILLIVGAVLLVVDLAGRPIGGRRWY
jgi:hypothetical protein